MNEITLTPCTTEKVNKQNKKPEYWHQCWSYSETSNIKKKKILHTVTLQNSVNKLGLFKTF